MLWVKRELQMSVMLKLKKIITCNLYLAFFTFIKSLVKWVTLDKKICVFFKFPCIHSPSTLVTSHVPITIWGRWIQSLSSGSSQSVEEKHIHKQIVMISCDRCHNISPKRHNREGRGLIRGKINELKLERWLEVWQADLGGGGEQYECRIIF